MGRDNGRYKLISSTSAKPREQDSTSLRIYHRAEFVVVVLFVRGRLASVSASSRLRIALAGCCA